MRSELQQSLCWCARRLRRSVRHQPVRRVLQWHRMSNGIFDRLVWHRRASLHDLWFRTAMFWWTLCVCSKLRGTRLRYGWLRWFVWSLHGSRYLRRRHGTLYLSTELRGTCMRQ